MEVFDKVIAQLKKLAEEERTLTSKQFRALRVEGAILRINGNNLSRVRQRQPGVLE